MDGQRSALPASCRSGVVVQPAGRTPGRPGPTTSRVAVGDPAVEITGDSPQDRGAVHHGRPADLAPYTSRVPAPVSDASVPAKPMSSPRSPSRARYLLSRRRIECPRVRANVRVVRPGFQEHDIVVGILAEASATTHPAEPAPITTTAPPWQSVPSPAVGISPEPGERDASSRRASQRHTERPQHYVGIRVHRLT